MEQKMVFIESNIVKSTPVGNASGKILKTIVTKNIGKYEENKFYDKPEFVVLFKQLKLSSCFYQVMN